MHHDGSNSARARSARIRAAHDYEATQLDSMRRNAGARENQQRSRPSLVALFLSAFGRRRSTDVAADNDGEVIAGAGASE